MKKLLIYIAAFAMILAMNTSCEDMGSLEEHPKKVDATTFMANAKEVESVINSIYFQLRRDPGFSRYLIVLEEGLADYCIGEALRDARRNYVCMEEEAGCRIPADQFCSVWLYPQEW